MLGSKLPLVRPTSRLGQLQSRVIYPLYCSISTDVNRSRKSSRYPYPEDPESPEDMLSSGPNAGLSFERTNVIDFWLVGFASVETEDTPGEKLVGWLKNDADGSWYRHLRSAALMLILKYSMLSMGMPEGNIYKLTVSAMMRSVLTFNLSNGIEETKKLGLVCHSGRKSLSLSDLEPYGFKDKKSDDVVIPETEAESPLTISSPRLTPGVRAADGFHHALVDPPESRFTASEGLSNIDHVRRHARAVIDLEKEYGYSPGPHRLDTLSPPVLAPEAIDEVARRYSRLPLERADKFHQKRMEQEIARLDIIISQAANRASALKDALARVKKRRAKYLEQLELIQTIKANNIMMGDKIKAEQLELKRLKSSFDKTVESPLVQTVSQRVTPRSFATSDASLSEACKGMEDDVDEEEALIQATMGV